MIARNRGKRFPAETLAADEVRALIAASPGRSSSAIRNRALIALTYRAALRVSEALSLRPHDVDLDPEAETVRVRNGKGGKARLVAIDGDAPGLVADWAERRHRLGINGHAPLFCAYSGQAKGRPLATSYLRKLLPRLAERAGLERRVHPHILRHTRAAELAAEGVPPTVIQRVLGHSSLVTTERYLAHVQPQQVVDAMRASDWRL